MEGNHETHSSGRAPETEGWPEAWDRYQVLGLVGVGGMARVYRAWDPQLRRYVAIKILRSEDPDLIRRFLREAQAQARVDHPNVCKVYEVGCDERNPYIAMQFINGEPLTRAVRGCTTEQKVLLVKQVAEALHAAHSVGLVHRDLKPANIMVETDAKGCLYPYVVDFGLVRDLRGEPLTVDGTTMGTPSFMAPEQAVGDSSRIDRRTDVYGLGATLYAILTGKPPFTGSMPVEVLRKVLDEDPPPLRKTLPSLPMDLEAVVMKCLEKDPARRYDSARALAEDLGRFLDGRPVLARPAGLLYRLVKLAGRNKALVAVTAAAIVVVSTLAGLWLQARHAAARQAELAQRFGQSLGQMEDVLWRAQSLPLHDIRPTRASIRKALGELEREMARLGSLALGPGHAALGRGYLALEDVPRARQHLEIAWESGYRTPEVAYALGSLMGLLYKRELDDCQKLANHAERARCRNQAERLYREPAAAYLRQGVGTPVADPKLLQAYLAFYEGRHQDALVNAQAAFARLPWLYEAKVIEGETHRAVGTAHEDAGRYEQAAASFRLADASLREALLIGRSAPLVHEALCNLWADALYLEVWHLGRATIADYVTAVRTCTDATTVDPENIAVLLKLAAIHVEWAERTLARGGDPSEAISASITAASAALAQKPNNVTALTYLASALWERAKHQIVRGADPREAFAAGKNALERALRLEPRNVGALAGFGLLLLDQGVWETNRGLDPTATLQQAAEAFQKAWALEPESAAIGVNLAMAYEVLLLYQVAKGSGDADSTAAKALEILEKVRTINPRLFYTLRTLGTVHTALAELERKRGRDPSGQLRQAYASLEEAIKTNPNDASTYISLAEAHLVAARFALSRGRHPTRELAAIRGALARAEALAPGRESATSLRREVLALEAQWGRVGR